jgi:nucleotide-binding universal stress UspA family protein
MATTFANVLFPTDFSEFSLTALEYARALTARFGGSIHCLHVVDEAYQYWSSMGPESIPVGPPPEDLVAISAQRMQRFVAEHLADVQPPVQTHVILGRPFVEIARYAAEHSIDCIVMATHGRGALAHMLLGSTTEKVVRNAPCPVMTVRSTITAPEGS